ncbi:MAG: glycerate kinase [Ignavibacterium sp.]|nr:glycerate kinase [Ignavibacterium sp.]MDW8375844.1 glycerate kinase [Ignavibacteriales bacterium]
MKILLATNSLKHSLSSSEIANILEKSLSKINKSEIIKLPLSDGGDGFLEFINFHKKSEIVQKIFQSEFAGSNITIPVLIDKNNKQVYIESAEVIGLKKLPENFKKPLSINSYPLGNLLKEISLSEDELLVSTNEIIIGIGGTATIDFGLGSLEALGFKFLNASNIQIKPIPENFSQINKIFYRDLSFVKKLYFVVDVNTKLLGENNAIKIYGLQKGATKYELDLIEKGISNIIKVLKSEGFSINEFELNGAGGGIAAGLNLFTDSKIISSIDYLKSKVLKAYLNQYFDYIVTSEGKFDYQSFEGKITGEIIKLFHNKTKKIYVLCGNYDRNLDYNLPENVEIIELRKFFNSIEDSILKSELGLQIASDEIIKQIAV